MMLPLLLLLFITLTEPVNSQGDEKLILKDPTEPCEGHVQVYHENQWGYVGDTLWNDNTEEVVCRSTHCGKPVKGSTGNMFRPIGSKVWLNELSCKGDENHLWECGNPGWGISKYRPDMVKTFKCSRKVNITLDGYECAGAVKFTTDESATPGYFCGDENWTNEAANLLCSSLKCGVSKEILTQPWFGWKDFKKSKKMEIKCVGTSNLNNLWQCTNGESPSCKTPASVICTGFQRLQLKGNKTNVCSGQLEKEEGQTWTSVTEERDSDTWCERMHCGTHRDTNGTKNSSHVICSAEVKVVLKGDSKCYGTVHVEVNGTSRSVCGSQWTDKDAEVVCQETGCGTLLSKKSLRASRNDGIMDYVRCSGTESSLWHCLAKRDTEPFQCNSQAYVVCSDSVKVKLVDGPGRCAGRVEIKHEGKWQRVNEKSWTNDNSDTVCRQRKCGNRRENSNPEEKFSQGSGDFLSVVVNCKKGAKSISECMTKNPVDSVREKEAVGITCEDHKVVFLVNETESCSGMVGIEHNDKTYWLSGSDETWSNDVANTVCRQMNCGEAASRNSTSTAGLKDREVWQDAYKCQSDSTSLFNCENVTKPSNHSDIIATVQCEGKFEVKLTQTCWGHVNICMGGKCGGVCKDTWTKEKSTMLCENLGCGSAIENLADQPRGSIAAMFKGIHTTKQTKHLSQCNFIRMSESETACEQQTAYVVCSGNVTSQIRATRSKCMGNVEVFYEGQYLPVCKEALTDQKTRDIICNEQSCGTAVSIIDYFGPKTQSSGIRQIQCAADKNLLKECDISPALTSCIYAGLQCSGHKTMELKPHNNTACSGALFVYSGGEKRSAVSVEGWTPIEGRRLCQDLKCGSFSFNKTIKPITNDFWKSSFSCSSEDNPQSIWDCEKPSTTTQTEQLYIQCEGEPNITLSGKCGGEIKIDNVGLCSTDRNMEYSHLVCQEMGCSNAVAFTLRDVSNTNTESNNVQCEAHHSKLGQCKRFKDKCDKVVSAHCVKKVKFNTDEKCGGKILINYRDRWETVCVSRPLSDKLKEQLCKELECDGRNVSSHIPITDQVSFKTRLDCTEAHEDIRYCISQDPCDRLKPAEIKCTGYVPKPTAEPVVDPPETGLILGVAFFVLLVILAVILFGICLVRRARRANNAKYPPRPYAHREEEFDDYDYEDIRRKTHQAENFGQPGFRPEAEIIMESDARSASSYDDIDESAVETRPLTSQSNKSGLSGGSFMPEDAVDQTREVATYEGEDLGEGYDDVEAVPPEVSQMNAEVHSSPGTSPESLPAPPPGLLEGVAEEGKDYLVPGQDW